MTEETLWRGTPSARVLIGRILVIIAVAIIGVVVTYFAAPATPVVGWAITAIVVLVLVIALAIRWVQLRSTLYTISNQRVIVERGIFSKSIEEIDLRYVEDTRFFQTFLERILGIGNVTLVSSDKTTPTFVLYHITKPRDIREMVRSHAYQVSQRQVFTRAT
jgi:uncharacterized membrane protein YdbT with pleckstrin-like domain